MNIKGFLTTALSQALELGMGSPDDVLRHVTPEILSDHLPRPLWARLLTACLGAPRVDAQLVIETVGIANLCEHIPVAVMWNCLSEIASRSLGREFVPLTVTSTPSAVVAMPASDSSPITRPAPLSLTPPPEERPRETPTPKPVAVGPAIPTLGTSSSPDALADVVAALENDLGPSSPAPSNPRARTPTSQRFRATNTGIGRLAANNSRRPQAAVQTEPSPVVPARSARRGSTEVNDYEVETEAKAEDWKNTLAVDVEEDQMLEWAPAPEDTQSTDEFGRKR
jgi:hypothetical protein